MLVGLLVQPIPASVTKAPFLPSGIVSRDSSSFVFSLLPNVFSLLHAVLSNCDLRLAVPEGREWVWLSFMVGMFTREGLSCSHGPGH